MQVLNDAWNLLDVHLEERPVDLLRLQQFGDGLNFLLVLAFPELFVMADSFGSSHLVLVRFIIVDFGFEFAFTHLSDDF